MECQQLSRNELPGVQATPKVKMVGWGCLMSLSFRQSDSIVLIVPHAPIGPCSIRPIRIPFSLAPMDFKQSGLMEPPHTTEITIPTIPRYLGTELGM